MMADSTKETIVDLLQMMLEEQQLHHCIVQEQLRQLCQFSAAFTLANPGTSEKSERFSSRDDSKVPGTQRTGTQRTASESDSPESSDTVDSQFEDSSEQILVGLPGSSFDFSQSTAKPELAAGKEKTETPVQVEKPVSIYQKLQDNESDSTVGKTIQSSAQSSTQVTPLIKPRVPETSKFETGKFETSQAAKASPYKVLDLNNRGIDSLALAAQVKADLLSVDDSVMLDAILQTCQEACETVGEKVAVGSIAAVALPTGNQTNESGMEAGSQSIAAKEINLSGPIQIGRLDQSKQSHVETEASQVRKLQSIDRYRSIATDHDGKRGKAISPAASSVAEAEDVSMGDEQGLLDQIQKFAETLNTSTFFWNQRVGRPSGEENSNQVGSVAKTASVFGSSFESSSSSPYSH